MTKYVRHFLEDALGNNPANISYTLGAPVGVPAVSQSSTMYLGDRVLTHSTEAPGFGSPSAMTRTGVFLTDLLSAVEVRTAWDMGRTTLGVKATCFMGHRVGGSAVNFSGYFLDFDDNSNLIVLKKMFAGGTSSTGADLATAPFVFNTTAADGTVVHGLFRAETIGGVVFLKAKAWLNDEAEPSAWMIDTSDAALPHLSGNSVVGCFRTTAAHAPMPICYICAATGTGESAPTRPKSWQEYLAFLDTPDALRCMLVEQNVLGDFGSPSVAAAGILCMSNYPFVSAPEDRYPNVCYEEILQKAPQMRRKLAAGGVMQISYGDVIFKNETTNSDAPVLGESFNGRLDNWLAFNVDGRTNRVFYGSPQWRRCDFKLYFVGVGTGFYRAGPGQLGLKLRGQEVMFGMAVSTEKVGGTGPNKDALAPVSFQFYFNVEPPLYDAATLKYRLESTAFDSWSLSNSRQLFDQGLALNQNGVYQSANIGTSILNSVAAHNLQVGMELAFTLGAFTLPAELSEGVTYYVARVPTASTFALTATPGSPTGAEIVYTTSPAAGATFIGRPYSYSAGVLTLLNQPAGRITAYQAQGTYTVFTVADGVAQLLLYAFASGSVRGTAPTLSSIRPIYAGPTIGGWWNNQAALGEAITQVTRSTSASFCLSRFGTYYLHQLGIPTGTAAWTIVADDIRNWKTGDRNLPARVERLGYKSNHTIMKGGDLAGAVILNDRDLYGKPYSLASYTPSESGLSQPDNHQMVEDPKERETMIFASAEAVTEVTRVYNLYRKPTGTFVFDTDAWALAVELGDEVSITYPKDGFAAGKNAIVIGITEDAMRGVVTLEVFCQIDELFPLLSSTSQPHVSGTYY